MADWILVASLKRLMADFDVIAPNRDHASDGSIGDTAHQREVSDHNPDETGSVPIHDADHTNEVHAIDVDNNLNVAGLTMEDVVQYLLGRCRSGAETRLRYIIYNRRIWEADNGWKQRTYTGASPHTEHAHFSASYDSSKEASAASWHLGDLVDLTPANIEAIWTHAIKVNGEDWEAGNALGYTTRKAFEIDRDAATAAALAPIAAAQTALADQVKTLQDKVDALVAALAPPTE
jgi:hypothetical protein